MTRLTQKNSEVHADESTAGSVNAAAPVMRIRSEDLFAQHREVEIDHHGRIYRLRLTQLNKLILTA
jgi:hemin uptake protein HemP